MVDRKRCGNAKPETNDTNRKIGRNGLIVNNILSNALPRAKESRLRRRNS